jgi:hypothetical protein
MTAEQRTASNVAALEAEETRLSAKITALASAPDGEAVSATNELRRLAVELAGVQAALAVLDP